MILAESIASDVNWSLVATIVMAVATAGMWWDARRSRPTIITPQPLQVRVAAPGNGELNENLRQLDHRVRSLEDWRDQLIKKLDDDKTDLMAAGEDRARRIYRHVDEVRSELSGKIESMPSRIIADLRNAKELLER